MGNEVAEFFCMLNIIFSAECTLIKQWISTCCICAHSLGLLNRVASDTLSDALEMQLFSVSCICCCIGRPLLQLQLIPGESSRALFLRRTTFTF